MPQTEAVIVKNEAGSAVIARGTTKNGGEKDKKVALTSGCPTEKMDYQIIVGSRPPIGCLCTWVSADSRTAIFTT